MICIMTVMVSRMHFISFLFLFFWIEDQKRTTKKNENLNTVPIVEKVSFRNCKQYIFYCPVGEHEHKHKWPVIALNKKK